MSDCCNHPKPEPQPSQVVAKSCCRNHDPTAHEDVEPSSSGKYFCPMCPGVESDQPGDCPKCGMAFRQGSFSESSGGGSNVWSRWSFLTHRLCWRTGARGEGWLPEGQGREVSPKVPVGAAMFGLAGPSWLTSVVGERKRGVKVGCPKVRAGKFLRKFRWGQDC